MGDLVVVNGATLACTFGLAPSSLAVIPSGPLLSAGGQPVARTTDIQPMANIAPFGMCTSLANPQVAAATSAAMGTLTPQPCIPVIPAPWSPGAPTVTAGSIPVLTASSMCQCAWAGVISITMPGQTTVTVG